MKGENGREQVPHVPPSWRSSASIAPWPLLLATASGVLPFCKREASAYTCLYECVRVNRFRVFICLWKKYHIYIHTHTHTHTHTSVFTFTYSIHVLKNRKQEKTPRVLPWTLNPQHPTLKPWGEKPESVHIYTYTHMFIYISYIYITTIWMA